MNQAASTSTTSAGIAIMLDPVSLQATPWLAARRDSELDRQTHDHEADPAPGSSRQSDHQRVVQVCLRTGHSWEGTHQHSASWACVGTGSLSRALSGLWSASAVWPMPYNE